MIPGPVQWVRRSRVAKAVARIQSLAQKVPFAVTLSDAVSRSAKWKSRWGVGGVPFSMAVARVKGVHTCSAVTKAGAW